MGQQDRLHEATLVCAYDDFEVPYQIEQFEASTRQTLIGTLWHLTDAELLATIAPPAIQSDGTEMEKSWQTGSSCL